MLRKCLRSDTLFLVSQYLPESLPYGLLPALTWILNRRFRKVDLGLQETVNQDGLAIYR